MGNGPIANNTKSQIEGNHIVHYEFKAHDSLEDHPISYRWVEYKREFIHNIDNFIHNHRNHHYDDLHHERNPYHDLINQDHEHH